MQTWARAGIKGEMGGKREVRRWASLQEGGMKGFKGV